MHPKLRTCIQNFARASKTTCVHPKLRACIQDYDRLTASQRISYHHFVFYIYVFLIIVNPLVRLGDGSDCYAVIFFSFYHLHALQSDRNSNSFHVLGRKYVFFHPESYFTNWGLDDFESRLKTYLSP